MNSTEMAERIEYERGRLGDSREPLLVGITSMFLSLCTLAVLLRGLVKHNRKIKLEADDFLCFTAFVSFVGFCITAYMMASCHVGRHTLFVQQLDSAERINIAIRNLMVAQQWLHLITITLIKLSILLLYRRIFTNLVKWFTMLWWACVAMTAVYFFIYVILIPLQGYPCPLNSRMEDLPCPFPDPAENYFAPGGAGNASMDLVILLLPIAMVWTLQMSKQNKSALIGVFILGSAAVAVSFARVPVVNMYYVEPDPIYDQIRSVLFALAESGTAIICACLPVLRPLLQPSTYKSWFSNVSGAGNSSSIDARRGSDNSSPSNSKRDRNPSSASAEMQLRDAGNLVNLKPQVWSPV